MYSLFLFCVFWRRFYALYLVSERGGLFIVPGFLSCVLFPLQNYKSKIPLSIVTSSEKSPSTRYFIIMLRKPYGLSDDSSTRQIGSNFVSVKNKHTRPEKATIELRKMKNKTSLLESFRNTLRDRIPSRPKLVKTVADILNIEKEPVSRRLNGDVSFSVDEVGKLAKNLHISIDSLLSREDTKQWLPYRLEQPWEFNSIEDLMTMYREYLEVGEEIGFENAEFGYIFSVLPVSLYINYPHLTKLALFRWGHYHVGSEEFYNYEKWEIPEKLSELLDRIKHRPIREASLTYIWDESLIWILCREIQSLYQMHAIDKASMALIAGDLHQLLTDLETKIKSGGRLPDTNNSLSVYITNTHVGANGWYHISDKGCLSLVQANFIHSRLLKNSESCEIIRTWIDSLKKISTLISGSGQKERLLFFGEQRKIVDTLLI